MENYLIILLWVWFQCLLSPHEIPVILEPAGCGEAILSWCWLPNMTFCGFSWIIGLLTWAEYGTSQTSLWRYYSPPPPKKKIKGSQLYFTELYWGPHFIFRLTNMIWCGNDLNHTKCIFRGKEARSDRRKTSNWIQPSVMSLPCTDNSDCSSCWSEVSIAGHQASNVNRKGRDSDAMRWALRAFTLPWLWAPWPKQINIWVRDQQEEKNEHEIMALTVFSLSANSTRQNSIDLTNGIRWYDLLMIHAENNLLTICNNNTNIYLLKPDSASLSQLRSWHDSASPKNSNSYFIAFMRWPRFKRHSLLSYENYLVAQNWERPVKRSFVQRNTHWFQIYSFNESPVTFWPCSECFIYFRWSFWMSRWHQETLNHPRLPLDSAENEVTVYGKHGRRQASMGVVHTAIAIGREFVWNSNTNLAVCWWLT